MANLWQFSSDRFKVNYLGLDLTDGLVEGSSIVWRSSTPAVQYRKDGLGGGIYVYQADSSGECDLFVAPEHPVHQKLITFMTAIRLSQLVNGPLVINDQTIGQKTILLGAVPTRFPDESRGSVLGAVLWSFQFAARIEIPNLQQQNAVA